MKIFGASTFKKNSVCFFGNCGDYDWYLTKLPGTVELSEWQIAHEIAEIYIEKVDDKNVVKLWNIKAYNEALEDGFPLAHTENYCITTYKVNCSMLDVYGLGDGAEGDCVYVAKRLNGKYSLSILDKNQMELF